MMLMRSLISAGVWKNIVSLAVVSDEMTNWSPFLVIVSSLTPMGIKKSSCVMLDATANEGYLLMDAIEEWMGKCSSNIHESFVECVGGKEEISIYFSICFWLEFWFALNSFSVFRWQRRRLEGKWKDLGLKELLTIHWKCENNGSELPLFQLSMDSPTLSLSYIAHSRYLSPCSYNNRDKQMFIFSFCFYFQKKSLQIFLLCFFYGERFLGFWEKKKKERKKTFEARLESELAEKRIPLRTEWWHLLHYGESLSSKLCLKICWREEMLRLPILYLYLANRLKWNSRRVDGMLRWELKYVVRKLFSSTIYRIFVAT